MLPRNPPDVDDASDRHTYWLDVDDRKCKAGCLRTSVSTNGDRDNPYNEFPSGTSCSARMNRAPRPHLESGHPHDKEAGPKSHC